MKLKFVLIAVLFSVIANAQQADRTSFQQLFVKDMQANKGGMEVLTGWGAANLIGGAAGYFASTDKEAKAFWGMNAIWGLTNAGIGMMGYLGSKKEMQAQYGCDKQLQRHENTKTLFLLNAGLDIGYIGTGVVLNAYGDDFNNPAMIHGFGKSIVVQGVGLLLFDCTMYALHKKQDKKWYKLMQGLCFTGNGVGFRYALN